MHLADLACSLVDLWKRHLYTDLMLIVEGKVLRCHRVVLAAASPYFHSRLFNGKRESTVDKLFVHNVSKPVLANVLKFIYCGNCELTERNAQHLLRVSHLYGIKGLRKKCDSFLSQHVTVANAIQLFKMAKYTKSSSLEKATRKVLLKNFVCFASSKKFQSLSLSDLISLVKDEDLVVPREDVLLDAVMFWAKGDAANRQENLVLLKHIRLPQVNREHLSHILDSNKMLQENEECFSMIQEAQSIQSDPRRQQEIALPQLDHRHELNMDECIVIIGGAMSGDSKFKCNQSVACLNLILKRWFPLAPLPFGFDSGTASCICGNDIYVCGGGDTRQGLVLYKSDENDWHICAPMSVGRRGHALVPIGWKLYVLGGAVGHSPQGRLLVTSSVEEYNMDTNEWSNSGEIAEAVWGMSTAVCQGKVYLFGGYIDRENPTVTVQAYDPKSQTSCIVSTLPFPCGLSRPVVGDDEIHLICPTGEILHSTDCFTFKQIATLPHFTRALFGVAVCKDEVLLLGGKYGNDVFDDIMVLDLKTLSVSSMSEKLHRPVWGFACNKTVLPRRHMCLATFQEYKE
ncbi:LOW QUALITY PROTEIN: kelch-like protein 24 [Gigantopelta aegis]|uniref:LOW QUALITY PROTEIN: kelch-like protein 24 n=1 Tax=Gigantopelta aegis TaxID=1735272 RepID=UPI001B8881A0|nr:LOW QUALITY PROTEIN: kelch-like protein 24 [Gigantopelta aegis]